MAIAELNIARGGLTGWIDPAKIQSGDLAEALNLDLSYGHAVQKEGGTAYVNAIALTGAPEIRAGAEFWPTAGIQRRVIATDAGDLLKDDMTGTFATTLKSGLTIQKHTHIISGGEESQGRSRKLFFLTGADPVQVLVADAATTVDIGANAPTDWAGANQPTFLFKFRDSIAGGGNVNDPHRVYISSPLDHEDFRSAQGGLTFSVYPGEGEALVAGTTARGRAYLWKWPLGIYYIDDSDSSSSAWDVKKITSEYGAAASPWSVAQLEGGLIAFLSSSGDLILMQESSGTLTGVDFVNLTKTLGLRSYVKNAFDLSRLDRTQLQWYADKQQLHVLLAALGSTTENRRLILDFNDEKVRVHVSNKDVNTAIWTELDNSLIARPIIGDNIGFVKKLDQLARSNETGAGYTMVVWTVPTDFRDQNAEYAGTKIFYRLHVGFESTGTYNIAAEIFVDGTSKGTVYFNQGTKSSSLSATLPFTLGGANLIHAHREIVGKGHTFSVKFTDASLNNPRITSVWVEFDMLDLTG